MSELLENWRTTVLGIVAVVVTVGFAVGTVSEHAFLITLGVLAGGVGAMAADSGKRK